MSEANLFPKQQMALGTTVESLDIYVDPATGNDATGSGTALAPYATIPRAYADVPYRLRHYVHIHLAGGAYTTWPQVIDNVYEPGGSLSFDASPHMVDVAAGPYTIDVAGVALLPNTYTARLTVAGGGLVAGAWKGKIIEFIGGTIAGNIGAVLTNTATTVDVIVGFTAPAAGDTFKIVTQGAVVTTSDDLNIRASMSNDTKRPFALVGVKLVATGIVRINDAPGVLIIGSDLSVDNLEYKDASMGGSYWGTTPIAALIDEAAWATNWNGCGVISRSGALCFNARGIAGITNMVLTHAMDAYQGRLMVTACGIVEDSENYCIDAYIDAGLEVTSTYLYAKTGVPAIKAGGVAAALLSGIYLMRGSCAIYVYPCKAASVEFLHGVDASVTNAIRVGQGARVGIDATTCDLYGASGAGHEIKWLSGAADAAYPALNGKVEDVVTGAIAMGY